MDPLARAITNQEKAETASKEAKAKYDAAAAQVPLPPNLAALKKIKYEADVALAQPNLDGASAQVVPRSDGDEADAKEALAFAREQINNVTGGTKQPVLPTQAGLFPWK